MISKKNVMHIGKSILCVSRESLKIPICIISTILFSALGYTFFGVWSVFAVIASIIFIVLIPNLFATFLVFTCFLPYIGAADVANIIKYFTDIWFYAYTILAASWIYHVFTHPKRIYIHVPLTLLFISYLLVCLLSLTGSFDLSIVEAFYIESSPYRRVLEQLLTCSLLLLSMSAFEKENQLEKIFWVVILTGIPLAILCLFIGEFGYFLRDIEPVGIFITQHPAAQHISFSTIMAFYLYKSTFSRKNRLILLACCALFIYIEILIASRTILTALILVIIISPLLEGKLQKFFYLIASIFVALFVLYPFLPELIRNAFMTIFATLIGDVDTSITASTAVETELESPNLRLKDIKIGLGVAARNPLLGVGIGKSMWVQDILNLNPPMLHNYYIVMLVETGIIGLSLFLTIILLTLFMAYRSFIYYRQLGNFKMYFLTKGMLLSVLSILIIFLAQPGWAEGERTLFFLIGLIAIVDRLRDRHKKKTEKEKYYPKFSETAARLQC